jgi:hypothetical protein
MAERKSLTWAEMALWQKAVAVVFVALVAVIAAMVLVIILLLLGRSVQVLWENLNG